MPEVVVKGTKVHYLKTSSKIPNPKGRVLFIHGSGGNGEEAGHMVMLESPRRVSEVILAFLKSSVSR